MLKDAIDGVRERPGPDHLPHRRSRPRQEPAALRAHDYWLEHEPDHHWDDAVGRPLRLRRGRSGSSRTTPATCSASSSTTPTRPSTARSRIDTPSMGAPPEAWAHVRGRHGAGDRRQGPARGQGLSRRRHQGRHPRQHVSRPSARLRPRGRRRVVLDDLQWADEASVDLLIHLLRLVEEVADPLRSAPSGPSANRRPGRSSSRPRPTIRIATRRSSLKPLDAERTDALVSALLSIDDLPDELRTLDPAQDRGQSLFRRGGGPHA